MVCVNMRQTRTCYNIKCKMYTPNSVWQAGLDRAGAWTTAGSVFSHLFLLQKCVVWMPPPQKKKKNKYKTTATHRQDTLLFHESLLCCQGCLETSQVRKNELQSWQQGVTILQFVSSMCVCAWTLLSQMLSTVKPVCFSLSHLFIQSVSHSFGHSFIHSLWCHGFQNGGF